jgi:hypothetical protein
MSEFQEVVRQMFRLHKACDVECLMDDGNRCPLFTIEGTPCGWIHGGTEYQVKQMEEAVMAWAKEHPGPVYPTWGEWFTRIGLYHDTSSANINANDLVELLFKRIPADIAQKLGIEPKEG